MLKYLILVVCGLTLTLSSCNVDCSYDCVDPDGFWEDETGSSKVKSDKCDDCDFFEVNLHKSTHNCTCSEG